MDKAEEFLRLFPEALRPLWSKAASYADAIQEIRLRANLPVIVTMGLQEYFLSEFGNLIKTKENAYVMYAEDMEKLLNYLCKCSVYAYEEELKQGYFTMPGGHRVGVAGEVILESQTMVRNMKYIRYMNIRISHQIIGAADALIPYVYDKKLHNTLIISPPGCGKTTLLRDFIRQCSNGNDRITGMSVGLVDERCEISGAFQGIAENDLGIRTDVLSACPKALGMMMLIRSMAPKLLAIDELGGIEEINLLKNAIQCGISVVATIHGANYEELLLRPGMAQLFMEKAFTRLVFLKKTGGKCKISKVYDEEGRECTASLVPVL